MITGEISRHGSGFFWEKDDNFGKYEAKLNDITLSIYHAENKGLYHVHTDMLLSETDKAFFRYNGYRVITINEITTEISWYI